MNFELYIENGGRVNIPKVMDGVKWTTDRKGSPGKLNFTVVKDSGVDFTEGNSVSLTVDGKKLFYGYVFSKKRDKKQHIEVTAYDQLRYLKNKDTYVYKGMTASELIETVAADFNLNIGNIELTSYKIGTETQRVEQNKTLFDIIYNALDFELTNNKRMYILYDDFGKLTLKSIDNMKIPLIIDEIAGENYSYTSTIDEQTYNKIKLLYNNPDTKERDVYISQDGGNMSRWGILQYFDTLKEDEDGEKKADALLELYNVKTRKLKITKAFGDVRVRAGSMPVINLNLGDMSLKNYMLVEKCTHTFNESEHWMDLNLRGGEFI